VDEVLSDREPKDDSFDMILNNEREDVKQIYKGIPTQQSA